jgi:hypothetical protein
MRTFDLVDHKLAEADFFLERLAEVQTDFFAAQCYFSAFASAARSVTFALQACLSDHPDFSPWYAQKQHLLKADPLARFFHRARTESQHLGVAHIRGGSMRSIDGMPRTVFHFRGLFDQNRADVPGDDVVTACQEHMRNLVALVYECYDVFGPVVDPEQYYTLENLRRIGKTVEDIEEELGYPRGWTVAPDLDEATRLRVLTEHEPGTELDEIFEKYLGRNRLDILQKRDA